MGQSDSRYVQEMTKEQREREKRRAAKRRKRRNQVYLARLTAFLIVMVLFTGMFLIVRTIARYVSGNDGLMETVFDYNKEEEPVQVTKKVYMKPQVTEMYLTPNEYSRPQESLLTIQSVFVHYTANQGTNAGQNRSYFEGLGQSGETSASAHFIIGYEGEIVQCLPMDEIGYAVKGRNYDSVSIECCYLDDSGEFTSATYQSLIKLTAWLLGQYDLSVDDILRHYDEGGKNCPKYYVENERAWLQFKKDVAMYIDEYGTVQNPADI